MAWRKSELIGIGDVIGFDRIGFDRKVICGIWEGLAWAGKLGLELGSWQMCIVVVVIW